MEELTLKTLLFTIVKNKALNRISHFEIRRKVHQEITENSRKNSTILTFIWKMSCSAFFMRMSLKQLPQRLSGSIRNES